MRRWPLFRSQPLYITRLLYSSVLQAKSQQVDSSNSITAWKTPPSGCPRPATRETKGQQKAIASEVAACLNKNPHFMTPHFSPPRVPKTASHVGHSCYKEGLPVWLQTPLSPRQGQEQDAGAGAGSAPIVSSHQEMCLPSIFGVSLGSDHSLGALNGASAAMITQIPGKWLKEAILELLCSLPTPTLYPDRSRQR